MTARSLRLLVCLIPMALAAPGGCRREEPAKPSPKQPATAATTRPALPGLIGPPSQDELDDPNAPTYLPKSNVVGTWVKHVAVRVAIPGELQSLLHDRAAQIEPYRIKQAATCVYRRTVNQQAELAYVELIETLADEDAFGILSIQCSGAQTAPIGQLTRVQRADGYHLHCWKGRFYVHVYGFAADDPTFIKALQELLAHIVFEMPAGQRPALLAALPDQHRLAGKQWFVRSARSLLAAGATQVPIGQPEQIDRLLGLNKDVGLLIAAYDQPGLDGPNYVWVAEYPTATQASRAYRRYRAAIDAARQGSPLLQSLLLAPRGRFLVGTWTAERESLMHILPRLKARLPP